MHALSSVCLFISMETIFFFLIIILFVTGMEDSAGAKCYGDEMGVDHFFDQIEDLLEFPNDDELLLDMDHMVGSSGSADECLLSIDVTPAASQAETNFEPMLLSLPEDTFLSDTQGDTSNGTGLIKVGDALNGEEEYLGPVSASTIILKFC